MKTANFSEALAEILLEDPRYAEEAYHFIREALDSTIRSLEKPSQGVGKHVSGRELLEGIREYALEQYGPLTKTVLNQWGLHETIDFGYLVFNLVEKNILGKTSDDKVADFSDGYTFEDAFEKPFRPDPDPVLPPLPGETAESA